MSAYLRELSDEFGESTNGVRVELNRMAKAGILETENKGKTSVFDTSWVAVAGTTKNKAQTQHNVG